METTQVREDNMQGQLVSQWITSLAISVVCCSVLFIVFAGYIVQLHESVNLQSVRIEMLLDRQNHLERDMATLRRTPVVTLNTTPQLQPDVAMPQPPKATSENGMELGVTEDVTGIIEKDPAKDDLILSATGDVALPRDALNPEISKMMDDAKKVVE